MIIIFCVTFYFILFYISDEQWKYNMKLISTNYKNTNQADANLFMTNEVLYSNEVIWQQRNKAMSDTCSVLSLYWVIKLEITESLDGQQHVAQLVAPYVQYEPVYPVCLGSWSSACFRFRTGGLSRIIHSMQQLVPNVVQHQGGWLVAPEVTTWCPAGIQEVAIGSHVTVGVTAQFLSEM